MSRGALAATQLLSEAHQVLREMRSPAVQVLAALRTAHNLNPSTGLRDVLQPQSSRAGAW